MATPTPSPPDRAGESGSPGGFPFPTSPALSVIHIVNSAERPRSSGSASTASPLATERDSPHHRSDAVRVARLSGDLAVSRQRESGWRADAEVRRRRRATMTRCAVLETGRDPAVVASPNWQTALLLPPDVGSNPASTTMLTVFRRLCNALYLIGVVERQRRVCVVCVACS